MPGSAQIWAQPARSVGSSDSSAPVNYTAKTRAYAQNVRASADHARLITFSFL